MEYKTFDKCMILIKAWRSRTDRDNSEYPDSRNPDIKEILAEFGVVPQELEKSMVALASWRSVREDVYPNLSSVVHTIRNRTNAGMFRSHITDALQFPEMVEGVDSYPTETENFKMLLKNLDDILEGKVYDITQGAIYYGKVGDAQDWFKLILNDPKYERTVQIGSITFYREKK